MDIEVAFLYVDDTKRAGDEFCEQHLYAGGRYALDRFPFGAHALVEQLMRARKDI